MDKLNLDAATAHLLQEILANNPGATVTISLENAGPISIRHTQSGMETVSNIEKSEESTAPESPDVILENESENGKATVSSNPELQTDEEQRESATADTNEEQTNSGNEKAHMESMNKKDGFLEPVFDEALKNGAEKSTSPTKDKTPAATTNDQPSETVAKNVADLKFSNFEGEVIQRELTSVDDKPFPESANILHDEVIYITEIIMAPKKFVVVLGNDVVTTTNQYNATKLLQYGRAAPLLILTSAFGDVVMPKSFFQSGIKAMTRNFWQHCKHITISGSWNPNALGDITDNLPGHIENIVMRRFTVLNAYRLRWLLKEHLKDLRYINFDSRCTDNRDMVTNIKFMADTSGNPFTRVFLNVEGFFANMPLFTEGLQRIYQCTAMDSTITVLTEQTIDDKLFEMLQCENFAYAGQGECESHLSPYGMQKYDLFNMESKNEEKRKITFGFLAKTIRNVETEADCEITEPFSPSDFNF